MKRLYLLTVGALPTTLQVLVGGQNFATHWQEVIRLVVESATPKVIGRHCAL